jgi:hypothetical protein
MVQEREWEVRLLEEVVVAAVELPARKLTELLTALLMSEQEAEQ